jgi:hypothetical protein
MNLKGENKRKMTEKRERIKERYEEIERRN